jgi:zinc protease
LLASVWLVGSILAAGQAWAQPAQVHTFSLANGMTVWVKPDRRAPTAVHMVWLRVGSMDEVDGTSGVAHVLEHMLFKGTPTLAAGEFSRRVAAHDFPEPRGPRQIRRGQIRPS